MHLPTIESIPAIYWIAIFFLMIGIILVFKVFRTTNQTKNIKDLEESIYENELRKRKSSEQNLNKHSEELIKKKIELSETLKPTNIQKN